MQPNQPQTPEQEANLIPQPQLTENFAPPDGAAQANTSSPGETKGEVSAMPEPSTVAVSVSTEMLAPTPQAKKKGPLWKILIVCLVLTILALGGYFAYTTFFTGKQSDIGAETDSLSLIEASAQDTTYLRPQSWELISEVGGSYGDGGDGKGTWTSTLVVDKNDPQALYVNASSEMYETLRSHPDDIIIQGFGKLFLQKTGKICTNDVTFDTVSDLLVKNHTVGLYTTTASCQTVDEIGITLKLRTVIGKDGAKRTMMIVASDDTWRQHSEAFKKILESIEQES